MFLVQVWRQWVIKEVSAEIPKNRKAHGSAIWIHGRCLMRFLIGNASLIIVTEDSRVATGTRVSLEHSNKTGGNLEKLWCMKLRAEQDYCGAEWREEASGGERVTWMTNARWFDHRGVAGMLLSRAISVPNHFWCFYRSWRRWFFFLLFYLQCLHLHCRCC